MSKETSYLVPSVTVCVEQEIKKSKFITTAGHVSDREGAKSFIETVSAKHPDASHNCYAYIAGDPGNSTDIGMGDDGEVSGTAGKPMLSVLQNKNIGEIAVVVSRYYGGVKLGPGGLVRAYTSSLQLALDEIRLESHIANTLLTLEFAYQYENSARQVLKKMGIDIKDIKYGDELELKIELPDNKVSAIEEELMSKTHGQARINRHNE